MFKRVLLIAIVLLGVATGVLFAFGDAFAANLVRRGLVRATTAAAARGIELKDLRFTSAGFAGIGVIRCDALSGRAVVGSAQGHRTFAFTLGRVVIDAGWPWSGEATVTLVDGHVEALAADGTTAGENVTRVQARGEMPFSWRRPMDAAARLEAEARRLLNDGEVTLKVELQAVANFAVAGRGATLHVRTERTPSGGARIALDRADIERLSREYTNPLTETEIDLVLRYPHRAPALLKFTEQASRSAREHQRRSRNFPFDAYRHVYWSWLLTRAFGPAFSEEVTDAHEVGATYEVGAESRRMDLQNNAVGRAYALAGVPESELAERVLRDPNIVRTLGSAKPETAPAR